MVDLKCHALQSDAAPEASSKQACEHWLEIGLPIGGTLERLLRGVFLMIAMPNGECQASADPSLLPERHAQVLQHSIQASQ